MATSDTVNIRIDSGVAELLAKRAEKLGLKSRQQLIDMILEREALLGGWSQPLAVPPGFLPMAEDLGKAAPTDNFAFFYRARESDPVTLLLGTVGKFLPTVVYVRPTGGRLHPILRKDLLAWEPYKQESDLFDIIGPWIVEGVWLHPTVPTRWQQDLANWRAQVASQMPRQR